MELTAYDHVRDFEAVQRMWREVGWVEDKDEHTQAMDAFLNAGHASVALVAGSAEALGHWTPGSVWYDDGPLSMCGITAITTSRVARRMGLASSLTVRTLQEGAEAGCAVAELGIFDQGFYDRLGFGTGSYEHQWSFDPASLKIDTEYRTPIRVSLDDWEEVHRVLTARHRVHGSITLDPKEIVRAEMLWSENLFGLGYRESGGRLTHFVLGSAKGEQGPYRLHWLGYETPDQILDLLRLVKELSDQVASISLMEPPEVQLQDVLDRPFRQRTRTIKSDHETSHRASAFWQARILDLAACVAARHWQGEELRFNLALRDPLSEFPGAPSAAGDYVVTIGAESSAEAGSAGDLPTLTAGIGGFTRMWLGVRPATSLSLTDHLSGPPGLLADLDRVFRLPTPRMGWFF